MSQSDQGKSDPTPPDENAGKMKKSKDVKEENVKVENDVKRKLSEISPPKRRKILHKMMTKYHKDPFYQPIDIAKKILKKLKVSNTPYFMGRVRQDMEKWINENDPDSDSDEDNTGDSKKKVLQEVQKKKKNILAAANNEKAKEIINPEAVAEKPGPTEAANTLEPKETKPKVQISPVSSNNVQTSSDSSSTVVSVEKAIPIIDLTMDIKVEIIKEETITIDEDTSSASTTKAANSTIANMPGSLPTMPYPMLGYNPNGYYYPEGFYPYYQSPYHNPNTPMYNPYMFSYDYQYPYNPYHFYNPPCNSDFLPNFPVDNGSVQDPKLVNSEVSAQEKISLLKDSGKSSDAGAAEELNKQQ